MAIPTFIFSESDTDKVVFFFRNSATPEEFHKAIETELKGRLTGPKIVKIDGIGPEWCSAMLVHEAHATPAVALKDEELGWVVVESHSLEFSTGQCIPF